jgi:hypothetical protein
MSLVETQDVCFEPDQHAYLVDGGARRVISVTQVLKFAGAISYAGIPKDILDHASWRGTMVHQLCELWDRGEDVETLYEIDPEILPYLHAWQQFAHDYSFIPDLNEMERARVVKVHGFEYGMKPDAPGWIHDEEPALIERKACAASHPSWALQTAAYDGGLGAPTGKLRRRRRIAVQLFPTGKYKAHEYTDPHDFDVFLHMHGTATWKLNNRLISLAA